VSDHCPQCHQSDDQATFELPKEKISRQPFICPSCHRKIVVVNVSLAAKIVGKSRQTIYNWIRQGRISYIRDAAGHPLIIYSSLFLRPVNDNEQDVDYLSCNEAGQKAFAKV
jgi:helix-turn-helix protein